MRFAAASLADKYGLDLVLVIGMIIVPQVSGWKPVKCQ